MQVYDALGPNPRALRMFLAEKGLDLPRQSIDLMGAENRGEAYVRKNPGGQVPALELGDGTVLAETLPIFEYLEEKHPAPPLIGSTAEERATTRMWHRRVELRITEHLLNGFRFAEGLPLFQSRMRCLPEAADGLKATARDGMAWLDPLLAGRDFVAGDRFTIADVMLYCGLDFGVSVGQPIDPALANLTAWFERVASRPSAEGSLHPAAAQAKIRG